MKNITEVMSILKALRRKKKITVEEVADYIKQETGIIISPKTVYGWENSFSKPDVMCFLVMCNLYGIQNVQELFNEISKTRKHTLKDKLYHAYIKNPEMQKAVRILLEIGEKES